MISLFCVLSKFIFLKQINTTGFESGYIKLNRYDICIKLYIIVCNM